MMLLRLIDQLELAELLLLTVVAAPADAHLGVDVVAGIVGAATVNSVVDNVNA